MNLDRFLFPVFGQKLMRNTLGIAVAQDPVLRCDTIIDDHSGRLCKLPEYRTLDLVQLSGQILYLSPADGKAIGKLFIFFFFAFI